VSLVTIQEIKELLFGNGTFWACVIFVVLSLIEVSKIKINPWTKLASFFGNIINSEVIKKIDNLKSEVDGVKSEINNVKKEVQDVKNDMATFRNEEDERNATSCRTRILRFGDEILHGLPHSKEHYDQTFIDIKTYEDYCTDHPKYKNNVAVATIKHIKRKYQEHLENDTFL
jgi:hypothetical protein